MSCMRCGGVMVEEEFSNGADGAVPWWYRGWRCLFCGDVIDPLILRHRRDSTHTVGAPLLRSRRRAAA